MSKKDSFHHSWTNFGAPKDQFKKKLNDGTTIFGSRKVEGKPSFKHGHSGANFHRPPYSGLGSAAIGKPTSYEQHKRNNTRRG